MAAEEDRSKKSVGFAGLSSLLSDLETDPGLPKSPKASPAPKQKDGSEDQKSALNTQQSNQPQSTAKTYQGPALAMGDSSWRWLLGIVAAVVVIWIAAGSANKSETSASSPSSPSAPSYSPPTATLSASRLHEELPPVGTNLVLSAGQLRYCLAEDIRLESAKAAVNRHVTFHVDRFNGMIADYNSRCGQFRYRKGALESARAEVERFRANLQIAGRERFSTGTSPSKPAPQVVKPMPDPTVQSIQQRLSSLGYDAGTDDGFVGGKTRSAISSFQRDYNLTVDGKPTEALLRKLQSTETSKSPPPRSSSQYVLAPSQPQVSRPARTPSWRAGEASGKPDSNRAPEHSSFQDSMVAIDWLTDMSGRLAKRMPDREARLDFLRSVHYEATRAGIDPQLVLALIDVVSKFKKYSVSSDGARGFMGVRPEWVRLIGQQDDNLFHLRTNLRYGCTILRHYLDAENGDLFRALARYNIAIKHGPGRDIKGDQNPGFPNTIKASWARYWSYTKG